MRKAILALLLAVLSSSAAADWVNVGTNDSAASYADPTTIRKTGDHVKMWNLFDFKTVQQSLAARVNYLSSKIQYEYDCTEERMRIIALSWHSGNMGGGEVVRSSFDTDIWQPVPPGSVGAVMWKIACGKT